MDITDKSCSCYEFQMLFIPCVHSIGVAVSTKIRIDYLVAREYNFEYLQEAYVNTINPVIYIDNIPDLASAMSRVTLYSATTRHPPGRPRKKIFFSSGKTRVRVILLS